MPKVILVLTLSLLPVVVSATSLWLKSSNNQRGMFGGKRAFAVGDLLTIDVAESFISGSVSKFCQKSAT